jgi:hypothetical protein
VSGQIIAEAPRERSRGKATHWQEQRAKSSQSVVARNDGNALRDREICRVVEEERAAALLEAAAVKKDHGGKRAGAGRGRGEHVQIQAVFGLHFGNIWVVVVLQAAGAEAARELVTHKRWADEELLWTHALPSLGSVHGWGSTGEAKRRGPTGAAA